ncbi:uncharacterized protein [Cherax quadricarinatus]|uniref:uncharacterized protein isoform X2 n=1 Tax=Cherax quadricarinatus TaxID=27406 RepID=UPI00387E2F62
MVSESVMVTGCSRGLGLEMVRQLVKSASPPRLVIATCRNPEKATELRDLAQDHNCLKILKFDVVDYKSLPRLVEEVQGLLGASGLNLLINNAAIMDTCPTQMFGVPLEQLEQQLFSRVMETNTTAPLMLTKAALNMLTKALAMEYGKEGILFVAIHPGWVRTDMGTSAAPLNVEESISDVLKTLSNLTEDHSGLLISNTGDIIPW